MGFLRRGIVICTPTRFHELLLRNSELGSPATSEAKQVRRNERRFSTVNVRLRDAAGSLMASLLASSKQRFALGMK